MKEKLSKRAVVSFICLKTKFFKAWHFKKMCYINKQEKKTKRGGDGDGYDNWF